jgi:hypothetical protein
MPKFPIEATLNPITALASGLRKNQPPILKGEDLTALKAISAAVVEEHQPVLPSELMWCNILSFSFFRLFRIWGLGAQLAERETNQGKLFHTLEYDEIRPAIEAQISAIQGDIMTLQEVFRKFSAVDSENPNLAIKQVFHHILGRDYVIKASALHKALLSASEPFNDESLKEDLKTSTESILEALRLAASELRDDVLTVEKLRSRLAEVKISTSVIHSQSDRLLNQELKLIQNIERSQANLARLAKMRGA